ncbi:hypothetical protein PoB_007644700 [Plakobranchus ocellatus]|uniref:Uncharacterized protein n=1 Tax=Plakobranchus ocellatus TaxID=259542 RepID=A0AAV4E0W8_9GAST|nr:hypothetical protein PoB_007644700 [Plakobranchus ocellatus]
MWPHIQPYLNARGGEGMEADKSSLGGEIELALHNGHFPAWPWSTDTPRYICPSLSHLLPGVGGTVHSESALRSVGTPLSRVRAAPPVPWQNEGPEGLKA